MPPKVELLSINTRSFVTFSAVSDRENLSPNDLDVHLQINPKVLGLKAGLVVTDAISGETLPVQGSGLTLPVPNKDFRLLVVSN